LGTNRWGERCQQPLPKKQSGKKEVREGFAARTGSQRLSHKTISLIFIHRPGREIGSGKRNRCRRGKVPICEGLLLLGWVGGASGGGHHDRETAGKNVTGTNVLAADGGH